MKIDKITWLDCVDSTNSYLKRNRPPGCVCVAARQQTAGRGRLGREFISPAGGLYFSVILPVQRAYVDLVTVAAALAVCLCVPGSGIKWPNDILLDNKKLCGILCEGLDDGRVIIGIGINIGKAPIDTAGCIQVGREQLLLQLLKSLEQVFTALENGAHQDLLRQYDGLLLTRGQAVRVMNKGVLVTGTALGIDDRGALLVQGDRIFRINSGEATILKDSR